MKIKILGMLFGICLGVVVSVVFFTNTIDTRASSELQKPPITVNYEKNESGQTYGPLVKEADPPELVKVLGLNGKTGYAYLSDMRSSETGWDVKNPEEAIAYMERLEAREGKPIIIKVYESDGKTSIDTFAISTTNDTSIKKVDYWD